VGASCGLFAAVVSLKNQTWSPSRHHPYQFVGQNAQLSTWAFDAQNISKTKSGSDKSESFSDGKGYPNR
jgi:hypothetical protein